MAAPKKRPARARAQKPGVIGERVQAELDRKGWRHLDLAFEMDVNPSLVSRIVGNKKDLVGATIKSLAQALGVSTDYLLGLSDAPERRR